MTIPTQLASLLVLQNESKELFFFLAEFFSGLLFIYFEMYPKLISLRVSVNLTSVKGEVETLSLMCFPPYRK